MNRLSNPPEDLIRRLIDEDLWVSERALRNFANQIFGLSRDEAITLLNRLHFSMKWNSTTFLACAELLDKTPYSN